MLYSRLLICIVLFIPIETAAQFICPPCNAPCDTLTFTAAGICQHCGMELTPLTEVAPLLGPNPTFLQQLQANNQENGQAMEVVSWLSDVYGPRLLGTENYWQALQWTKSTLHAWGIEEVEFHSFNRSHRAWQLKGFSAEMVAPTYAPLLAYPAAFTQPTNGTVEGDVVYLNHWQELYEFSEELVGKIILLGDTYRPVNNQFSPSSRRYTDEELASAAENPDPNHRILGYLSRRSINQALQTREEQRERFATFFEEATRRGVIAIIEASNFPYGLLHADGNNHFPSYPYLDDIQPPAGFVLANEHFGRLKRLIEKGFTPRLKLMLDASYQEVPEYQQNLLATLPGNDPVLAGESVLMGGHFDSWHAGTGAIDNASGVAVMMEALRLLKKLNIPLKRTVQLALWGGEEQFFAGSFAFVEDFIGDINTGDLKDQSSKISAYFNLDNGAGKIRGIYTMGNKKVMPIFTDWLAPFPDANTLTVQYANQTDHELFDRLNIPAFQFIQDPLNYLSVVHHTNLDVPEYIEQEDLNFNAVLVAYLIYQVANAPALLPRKTFNSPKASRRGETLFELTGFENAKQVQLIGDFNNWNLFGTPMYKTPNGWACRLALTPGEYVYKFYTDGQFIADPQTPQDQLTTDGKGHGGLTQLLVE